MISLSDYVGPHSESKDWTDEVKDSAELLLERCNRLIGMMGEVEFKVNPKTGTHISGETYGGFRPQSCPIGASKSSHKQGRGVDIYDPAGHIDDWIMANKLALVKCGLFIEHPDSTPGWSHWTDRQPRSGASVFRP